MRDTADKNADDPITKSMSMLHTKIIITLFQHMSDANVPLKLITDEQHTSITATCLYLFSKSAYCHQILGEETYHKK